MHLAETGNENKLHCSNSTGNFTETVFVSALSQRVFVLKLLSVSIFLHSYNLRNF